MGKKKHPADDLSEKRESLKNAVLDAQREAIDAATKAAEASGFWVAFRESKDGGSFIEYLEARADDLNKIEGLEPKVLPYRQGQLAAIREVIKEIETRIAGIDSEIERGAKAMVAAQAALDDHDAQNPLFAEAEEEE